MMKNSPDRFFTLAEEYVQAQVRLSDEKGSERFSGQEVSDDEK
jgi:hypothetical protein